jgi:hypothetical protein
MTQPPCHKRDRKGEEIQLYIVFSRCNNRLTQGFPMLETPYSLLYSQSTWTRGTCKLKRKKGKKEKWKARNKRGKGETKYYLVSVVKRWRELNESTLPASHHLSVLCLPNKTLLALGISFPLCPETRGMHMQCRQITRSWQKHHGRDFYFTKTSLGKKPSMQKRFGFNESWLLFKHRWFLGRSTNLIQQTSHHHCHSARWLQGTCKPDGSI